MLLIRIALMACSSGTDPSTSTWSNEPRERERPPANATFTLVESAGGWRVPITRTADMATLALRLGLPVIIVARAGLGTINHSLLTIEAVERDGCHVAALVLTHRPTDDPAFTASNRAQIERRWPGPLVILGNDAGALDRLIPDPQ